MRMNSANAFLLGSMDWWDRVEKSKVWQTDIFDIVGALYAVLAIAAIVQLVRIQLRVPEYGWTTQKVFHLLNILVGGARAGAFLCRRDVQSLKPVILRLALMDLPGLLFFTTYTLLVLFWAEIYYQARSISTDGIRRTFLILNAVIYLIQLGIWIYFWPSSHAAVSIVARIFFAGVSFLAALGFLLYGGRLFLMLQQFPVESKGRQKKLREVGFVTTICSTCFLIRCFMVIVSTFVRNLNFDSLEHPLIAAMYYMVVEILPAALVLYILRKLPPRRGAGP